LQDLRGVIFEDETEKIGKAGEIFGIVAEELGGAVGPGGLFEGWVGGEPVVFAEEGENVGGGVGVDVAGTLSDVVVGRHERILAHS
jgi:hypothetical protein